MLFEITSLRNAADSLGIKKIDAGPKGARIDFHPKAPIDPTSVITLLQSEPRTFRLDGPERIRVTKDMLDADARLEMISSVLTTLKPEGNQ